MPKVDTWMPIYWGDYAKDTGHLSAVHHGAYLMLIKHYWTHGTPLPADDNLLWRIACTDSLAHWRKIRAVVLAFFEQQGDRLHHRRIDEELANAQGNAERRAELARKAANSRWGEKAQRKQREDDAPRMPGACPPPSPSPADNSHGKITTDAVSASASPDGPPRPRLPDTAKWAERLDQYQPWRPHGDPLRGRWTSAWGYAPDSSGTNPLIPTELLRAWKAKAKAEYDALRSSQTTMQSAA